MNTYLPDAEATARYAMAWAKHVTLGSVVYLRGELGAGKTSFVRGVLHGLGYDGLVKSPTYTLVETYDVALGRVYHFDCYRLSPGEFEGMGGFDYFSASSLCMIEWPECLPDDLPAADLECAFSYHESSGRRLQLTAHSERGKAQLDAWQKAGYREEAAK